MQESRFTETQIVSILKSADAWMRASELCPKRGISEATYYSGKSLWGGMEATKTSGPLSRKFTSPFRVRANYRMGGA